MKKILYSVFMLATMVLAACSSDDTTEPAVKRGMVLKANVEDTDTRATLTDNEGKWKFAFATNDMVKVGNDKVDGYYTFTNDGTVFTSTDAQQTTEAATWYAYFPGETISLANQSGAFADVANKYALAGATTSATTGSDGLTVTMKAKVAVLRIVGVNKDEKLDISVKDADGKYVSGLTADKKSADFIVDKSDTKVSLLFKQGAGVYYVVVPAGVKLLVYKGKELIKATKAGGLTAGKYYTLKTGDTDGWEYATINGEQVKKYWVQLWPGGPKFATENVAEKMNFTEACKTGDAYVWGANWRTPTKDEIDDIINSSTKGLVSCEVITQEGKVGLLYKGLMPEYTDKTLFINSESSTTEHVGFSYWTSTKEQNGEGHAFSILIMDVQFYVWSIKTNAITNYFVRPVLAK
ncbi:fimbrillin family protein [Leyella stercorea]|uniref:fimbrillin family protein n=1 Tax=Leyella stercorea TaxID=363265 RepID=UPI00242FD2FD|nr:fimbrillin family protein [Leyella stercorea]